MEQLTTALFLAVVNTKLIDYLKAPIARKWPALDLWWLVYVALATGLALTWAAGINLFGNLIANETVAVLLSGIVIGGGSSLIYDVFSDRPASITAHAEAGGAVSADVTTTPAPPTAGADTE